MGWGGVVGVLTYVNFGPVGAVRRRVKGMWLDGEKSSTCRGEEIGADANVGL